MAILRETILNNDVILNPGLTHKARVEFEVVNGNPNGDPDTGGVRMDSDDHAVVTDVATKRKVRDYVSDHLGRLLYIDRGIQEKMGPRDKGYHQLKDWAAHHGAITAEEAVRIFWDVKMFGGVIGQSGAKNQILGPVQVLLCQSVDPVIERTIPISGVAGEGSKSDRTFGTKNFVDYAKFIQKVRYSGHTGLKHNVSKEEMADLWEGLVNGFEFRQSTMRGEQVCTRLVIDSYPNSIGAGSEFQTTEIVNPAAL